MLHQNSGKKNLSSNGNIFKETLIGRMCYSIPFRLQAVAELKTNLGCRNGSEIYYYFVSVEGRPSLLIYRGMETEAIESFREVQAEVNSNFIALAVIPRTK